MPLMKSGSKEALEYNISELRRSGRPEAQAVAIAYDVQRRAGGKKKKKPSKDKK